MSAKLHDLIEKQGQGISPGVVFLQEMWFHYSQATKEMQKPEAARNNKELAKHLANARMAAKEAAPYVHNRLSSVLLAYDPDALVASNSNNATPQNVNVNVNLSVEYLSGLSEEELVRVYRSQVAASDGNRARLAGPQAGGNGPVRQ